MKHKHKIFFILIGIIVIASLVAGIKYYILTKNINKESTTTIDALLGFWEIKDVNEDPEVRFYSFEKGGKNCPNSQDYITLKGGYFNLVEGGLCMRIEGNNLLSAYLTRSGVYPDIKLVPSNEVSMDKSELRWNINNEGELELVPYYNGVSEVYNSDEEKMVQNKILLIRSLEDKAKAATEVK